MSGSEFIHSKPVVHWVSEAPDLQERIEVEQLKINFALQLYDSVEGFLSRYHEASAGCIVLCCDHFSLEVSDLYKLISYRNELSKVILCLVSLDVPDVVQAIKLGFANVIQIPSNVEQLRRSVEEALESASKQTLNNCQANRCNCVVEIPHQVLSRLNSEETRIFQCLAEGITNKQISAELGLSVRTIHYRKKIIFEKLRIGSRSEAIEMLRILRTGSGGDGGPRLRLDVEQC